MASQTETRKTRSPDSAGAGFDLEAMVDAALANGFRWVRFEPRLEQVFEQETGDERSRHLVRATLPALVIYIFFMASDYQLAHATFGEAIFIRLGIVLPAVLLALFAIHRGLPPFARESLATAALTLVGLSVIYLFGLAETPGAIPYDSGLILVIAFIAVVVRLRFWHMVGSTVTMVAAYIAMTTLRFGFDHAAMQNNTSILVAGAIFMVVANYVLEREHRRAYLYRVRNRIHVDALRQSNDKLMELSHLDPLTGIGNRRQLDEHLARLCQHAGKGPFGIIMLDIDHFKNFNDRYGHPAGDECIRRVANILQASLRLNGDRVARFGGEEFVALLPRTGLKESIDVAERMRRGVRDLTIPHDLSPIASVVTISAGVLCISSVSNPKAVLAQADAALYRAKGEGRDRVCVGEVPENVPGTDELQERVN